MQSDCFATLSLPSPSSLLKLSNFITPILYILVYLSLAVLVKTPDTNSISPSIQATSFLHSKYNKRPRRFFLLALCLSPYSNRRHGNYENLIFRFVFCYPLGLLFFSCKPSVKYLRAFPLYFFHAKELSPNYRSASKCIM